MPEPIRVTEVLNYFKEPWYIDWVHKVGRTEANKIGKAAMKVGSRVDELIKDSGNGWVAHKTSDSQEVWNCCKAYNKWVEVYKPGIVCPGTRLFATIEGKEVTGEPDIFVDGVLVDIKCSSKISPSYWVQVNMYRRLQGKSMDKVAILRLDKVTASYEYVVKDYDPKLVSVWCGIMRAYVYFKGDENGGLDIQEVGAE